MLDVRAAREAMANALAGRGLEIHDVLPGGTAKLPVAVVGPPSEVRYHRTGANGSEAYFTVTVAVAQNDRVQAQATVDAYMSWPNGLAKSLEDHDTDAWRSLVVEAAREVRQITVGQATALAFDLVITLRK